MLQVHNCILMGSAASLLAKVLSLKHEMSWRYSLSQAVHLIEKGAAQGICVSQEDGSL